MAIEAAIETIQRIAFSVGIDRSRTVREQETMDRNAPDDQSARSTWRLAMSAFVRVDPFQSRAIDTPMLESGMTQNAARGRIGRMMMLLLGISAGGCRGAEGPAGPTGPAGGGAAFFTASGTTSLVANTEMIRYTAIPGLSASVETAAGGSGQVLIETDGGIQLNSDVAIESCFIDVAVFVDGAQVGSGRRVQVLNNATVIYAVSTYGFSVETTLTPGTHAIAVMAKRFTPTFADCYVSSGAGGSGLPGNPRLQGVLNIVAFR